MTDTLTFWAWVAPWPAWLALELVILWLRRPGTTTKPRTISQVARDRAWQLNVAPYLWGGMATHWWAPGTWATVASSLLFWVGALGLLTLDVFFLVVAPDRYAWPPWLRKARTPALWLLVGALAGWVLFPQPDGFYSGTWGWP